MTLDHTQRVLGVELAQHHDGLAERVGVEREGAGRRVIERAGHEMHVVRVDAVQGGEPRQHRRRIGGPAPRALRLAGGAGRVDHRAAQSRRRRHRRR